MTETKPMTKVLIYGGKTGWIGGMMHDMCKAEGTWWKHYPIDGKCLKKHLCVYVFSILVSHRDLVNLSDSLLLFTGIEVYNSEVRIENRADVEAELDQIAPSHVLMAAG